jgi:hypothetical protein
MQELKCEEDTGVCAHLETMAQMHEELAGMGGAPDPKDYLTILLSSLPKSYGPLLNAITVAASITKMELKADNVITQTTKEYDRRTIEACQLKANKNALAANSHRKGQH